MTCWHCAAEIPLPSGQRVGMRDACPSCDADLHACRNCRHYDPAAHHECRENQAEWVRDKDRNNRCDYFDPIAAPGRGGPQPSSGGAARTGFDALFKK
jgi:hypothetical protein